MRVVETIIREGAAGRNAPELCLLCTEEFLFLSQLHYLNSCLDVIILELPEESTSKDSEASE